VFACQCVEKQIRENRASGKLLGKKDAGRYLIESFFKKDSSEYLLEAEIPVR